MLFVVNFILYFLFQYITADFIKNASFEVDICGTLYPAQARLNPPVLPKKVNQFNLYIENI